MGTGAAIGDLAAAGAFGAGAATTATAAGGGLGGLFALLSSERFKHEIETLGWDLRGWRWVSFKYLPELDPFQATRVGVIAEELMERMPEAVVLDQDGLPAGVRYGMLR